MHIFYLYAVGGEEPNLFNIDEYIVGEENAICRFERLVKQNDLDEKIYDRRDDFFYIELRSTHVDERNGLILADDGEPLKEWSWSAYK